MITVGESILSKPDGLKRLDNIRSAGQRRIGYTADGRAIKPIREKRKATKS